MLKTSTLTQNRDFLRLYKRGKSYVQPSLVLYLLKNKLGKNRIGITTSKKIGTAVMRNRARRVIREAYRSLEPELRDGYDFVFVARGKTVHVKTDELIKAMKSFFSNAGVWKP